MEYQIAPNGSLSQSCGLDQFRLQTEGTAQGRIQDFLKGGLNQEWI